MFEYEQKLHDNINIIMNKISILCNRDDLDIHDMADLQRYSDTLKNLSEAHYLLWQTDMIKAGVKHE